VASVSNVSIEDPNFHWYSWFTMAMFYQYGLVYTCVRLTYNVSQTLIVFYVLYTLKMANGNVGKHTPIEVALVPLAIYVFSCIGSFSCERFYIRFGRKYTYLIGAATLAASSVFMTVNFLYKLLKFCQFLVVDTRILLFNVYMRNFYWGRSIFKHEHRDYSYC